MNIAIDPPLSYAITFMLGVCVGLFIALVIHNTPPTRK